MAVACHSDGKRVAAGGIEGKILLSNLSGDEPPVVLAEGLEGPVIGLAWDAEDKRLAFTCQSTSQSIGLIDLASKRILWRTKTSHRPGGISWSPDGSQLVVGLTGFLSAETGDPINDPSWHEHASVVAWGREDPNSLIACNDYRLNRLSVFSPARPDDGWLALLIGDGAASFTPAGELIDASAEAKSQLRYHVETDDGTVSLMSHEEFSSLCRKLGQVSKPDAP